jgi:hypothetical protein
VVAIDSRSTITPKNGQVRFNDGVCKIRPLAPHAFFFSTGLDRVFYEMTEREFFDARDTASDAYASAARPPNFEVLTDKWATWMEASFRHAKLLPEALKDQMTRGFFVGTKDDGELTADAATIGYHADGEAQFTHTSQSFTPTAVAHIEQPVDKPLTDIESEFANGGQTDRAKKVMQDTGWATAKTGPDATALHLSTLVAAVRDWSGNDKIGGDIATWSAAKPGAGSIAPISARSRRLHRQYRRHRSRRLSRPRVAAQRFAASRLDRAPSRRTSGVKSEQSPPTRRWAITHYIAHCNDGPICG